MIYRVLSKERMYQAEELWNTALKKDGAFLSVLF